MKLFDYLIKAKDFIGNSKSQKIIEMFYADYPETPYISNDRKPEWIEMAKTFPKTAIVKKSMMKRYSDGLLPGHVYMLYWLKKYTNKKVPSYFEYQYGIDFEKERTFLLNEGFLDSTNKPTAKGDKAIENHSKVIENHAPKRDVSIAEISQQILKQRDSLQKNGFKEYQFIANRNCCAICTALNGKHLPLSALEIGVNAPPMHEGCSCSIAAYEARRELDEILDYVERGGTYEDWKRSKKKKK
jgi:SPP1 gp7 family putative phage head morphogenesis protein